MMSKKLHYNKSPKLSVYYYFLDGYIDCNTVEMNIQLCHHISRIFLKNYSDDEKPIIWREIIITCLLARYTLISP